MAGTLGHLWLELQDIFGWNSRISLVGTTGYLWLELQEIFIFLSLVKNPPDNFCLSDHVQFVTSSTHSSSSNKIHSSSDHSPCFNTTRHFYFNCLPRLWNSLPHVDLNKSLKTLRNDLYGLYWNYFLTKYDPYLPCTWYRARPILAMYMVQSTSHTCHVHGTEHATVVLLYWSV